MHEASLMNGLLDQVATIAAREGDGRVAAINVYIGALAQISDEHFREHFVEATYGTDFEDVELSIEMGENIDDPHAQDIVLKSVEIEQ